ncbi:hypothetical protein Peur_069309 [Populus x canadensis]
MIPGEKNLSEAKDAKHFSDAVKQFCESPKHCSSDNGVKLPQITGSRNESDDEKNDLVFEDNDEESKEGEDSNLAIYCLKFVIVFFPSSRQSMEE